MSRIRKTFLGGTLFLAIACASGSASAATLWNGNVDNDWFVPGNWSAGVPTAAQDADITIVDTVNIGAPGAVAKSLDMTKGTLNINTDGITVSNQSIIGGGTGAPTINQSGGAVDFNGNLYISNSNDGTKDTYNFNGGTLQAQNLIVYQWGEFNHNNPGTVLDLVTGLSLGTSTTGNSFFNLNGNEMTIGSNLTIGTGGNTGSGTFDFGDITTAKINFTAGAININGNTTFNIPNLTNPLTFPGASINGASDGFSVINQQGGDLDFDSTLYVSNNNDGKKDEYNFDAGTLQVQNLVVYQWGEFNHNNAGTVLDIVGSVSVGNSTTGDSFFNLNGNEMNIGGNLNIGSANNTGSGTFDFGDITTAKINLSGGINVAGNNTFTVPNLTESLTIPGQSIIGGAAGFSVFNQQGGDLDFDGTLYTSNNDDGMKDQYNFNAGTLQVQSIISYQWGEFNHNNPGEVLDVVGSVSVGNSTTGHSFFNLNGNEMNIGGNLTLGTGGNTGSGTFDFGNPATAKVNLSGGINILGNNTFTVPAGLANALIVPGQSILGNGDGESIYTQEGSDVTFQGNFYFAHGTNTGGEIDKINLNDGNLNINNLIRIRKDGIFTVNDGTLTASSMNVGIVAGHKGVFESKGGTSIFSGPINLDIGGDTEVDEFRVSGGDVSITGANDFTIQRQATATISGGTLTLGRNLLVGTIAGAFDSIVNQSDGVVSVAGNLELATVGGSTGDYNLTGGTLTVGGTLDLANAGDETFVLNGGTLSATLVDDGEAAFDFQSGTINPGGLDAIGSTTFTVQVSALDVPLAGTLAFDLEGATTAGVDFDQLVLSGDMDLNGELEVVLLNGFLPLPADVFEIVRAEDITGTFNNAPTKLFLTGVGSFDVVYNFSPTEIDTIQLTNFEEFVVPEPSTLSLLGLGLLGLMRIRRRKRMARS